MKTLYKTCVIAVLFYSLDLASTGTQPDSYAVVVHRDNLTTLDKQDIARIYLGKSQRFPGDGKATPLMRDTASPIGKAFLKSILHKRPAQYKSYWMNMIFTGEGNPPTILSQDQAVIHSIASDASTIGIVEKSSVDKRVKVVITF